jgi:hypothetical protein
MFRYSKRSDVSAETVGAYLRRFCDPWIISGYLDNIVSVGDVRHIVSECKCCKERADSACCVLLQMEEYEWNAASVA